MNNKQVQLILDSLCLNSKEVDVTIYMNMDYKRFIEISFYNNYRKIYEYIIELSTNEFNSLDLREYLLDQINKIRKNLIFI
jgi:hypothetical protein